MSQGIPSKACLLVVDDEATIRRLLERHFERHGFDVILAEDGETALRIFESRGDQIDLVILDMLMPRLGGLGVLAELRRTHPRLPVLISSGFTRDADREAAEALGVQGFVAKPFSLRDLTAIVRSTLDESEDAPPAPVSE